MKILTSLVLLALFFIAGAHVFALFTSPYFLTTKENIQLIVVVSIMLFSLVAFIAVVEPHKYVKQIISYTYLVAFLLFVVRSDYIVGLL